MKIRGNTVSTTMRPDKIVEEIDKNLRDDVSAMVEEAITDKLDYITEHVIGSLPIYDGEVVE